MWDRELREASESFTELFFPSVQAQLVGEIGQSFSTICIIISKEASVFVRLLPQYNIRPLAFQLPPSVPHSCCEYLDLLEVR